MSNRMASDKSRLNRWARGTGKLAAQTEMTVMEAKTKFGAKVRDISAWKLRVLKMLAEQHQASHRALKEFKVGLERASAELNDAYQSAVSEFRS